MKNRGGKRCANGRLLRLGTGSRPGKKNERDAGVGGCKDVDKQGHESAQLISGSFKKGRPQETIGKIQTTTKRNGGKERIAPEEQ